MIFRLLFLGLCCALVACQANKKLSSPIPSSEDMEQLELWLAAEKNLPLQEDQTYTALSQVIHTSLKAQAATLYLPGLKKRVAAYPAMVSITGGPFSMGSYNGDKDERPVHQVLVADFQIAAYEVTFAEFDRFCEATNRVKPDDKDWGRGNRPAVYISWLDAINYCNWLSTEHRLQPVYQVIGKNVKVNWQANGYRLPTEAEWEYAAKGGSGGSKWMGTSSMDQLATYANYVGLNDGHQWTAPVGSYKSNTFGLYDMSGNVWEWCWDYWRTSYPAGTQVQPKGPRRGLFRVTRGGSWDSNPASLRCSNRNGISAGHRDLFIGFRLCRN